MFFYRNSVIVSIAGHKLKQRLYYGGYAKVLGLFLLDRVVCFIIWQKKKKKKKKISPLS